MANKNEEIMKKLRTLKPGVPTRTRGKKSRKPKKASLLRAGKKESSGVSIKDQPREAAAPPPGQLQGDRPPGVRNLILGNVAGWEVMRTMVEDCGRFQLAMADCWQTSRDFLHQQFAESTRYVMAILWPFQPPTK